MAEQIHGAALNGKVLFENKDDTLIAPSNIPNLGDGVSVQGGIRVEGNLLVISIFIQMMVGNASNGWYSIYDDLSSITGGKTVVPTKIPGITYADTTNIVNSGDMLVNFDYGSFNWGNKIAIYPGYSSSSECWTTYNGTALLIDN
ncbi:MAG: hypothetical protein ABF753_03475 [Lentilactobacillus hilgardii]|uniref:hypothetical protein n=1 Tax=Lentilactobacillus hilgardii TaxID=1588 RepID=UPI0039EBD668